MSLANWNNTAFYLVGDIVVFNGEDYEALLPNYNVLPLGNPLTWNPLAPPGPGPSNQLAFNQATNDLSIVGGNTVNLSLESGFAEIQNPANGVIVPTITTLSQATTIISLAYADNGDPRFVAPTNQTLFYRVQNANSFSINASAPAGVPNGKLIIAWSILRP